MAEVKTGEGEAVSSAGRQENESAKTEGEKEQQFVYVWAAPKGAV